MGDEADERVARRIHALHGDELGDDLDVIRARVRAAHRRLLGAGGLHPCPAN